MYNFNGIIEFLEKWENNKIYDSELDILNYEYEKYKRICNDKNSLSGPILTKNDENFLLSLEDGVRDLIYILIYKYNLITIGSCEGHKYLSNEYYISKRFIKILWRNETEFLNKYNILENIIEKVNKKFLNIKIGLFDFNEKFPNNHKYHLCFLVFLPFTRDIDKYYQKIDDIYKDLLKNL